MQQDTIAAIATAPGKGGVAIIRLSGSPFPIIEKMFRPAGKTLVSDFESYRMYPGEIDGGTFTDFGLCVLFRAPKSFTGEDVAELHCHGGVSIARGILRRAFALGARSAERGEFTKRAFLNGKVSLSSAEGMVDMINAESEAEVRAGYALYTEQLSEKAAAMQTRLTTMLAGIDCDIDYPEEDLEFASMQSVKEGLSALEGELSALLSTYAVGKKIKQGVSVAIAGKPNAGKSSLLNALLGYEKAIVSEIAGTTRDAVEGTIELNGVRFHLMDTAGLHASEDTVESIGIERAKKLIEGADVVLLTLDEAGADEELSKLVRQRNPIIVHTKGDLQVERTEEELWISSRTGENLERLKALLYERGVGLSSDASFLLEERHYQALRRARESVVRALSVLGTVPLDLLAIDIKEAWTALGEISGETASERIIDEIFAKFCVGK